MKSALPRTTAESSRFYGTSLYADVIAFIEAMQRIDPTLLVEQFGTSVEGRALPLVVVGPPGVVNPQTARESGRPVVFVMGNIHSGEVEGKEAALMLLRDLVTGKLRGLRDRMVILIAPIYNADGNEKLSLNNRPTQLGPPGGSGTRENAQGLDLNRDFLKLESPEANGLVRNVLHRWDPLLTIDLHTTNGSYHGYGLTYAPMLTPNAPAELIRFSRERLFPPIQEQMRHFGHKTYYYGNFLDQLTPEKGWYTFDARPRFGNNYVGLRNRFVILSEAYSYIDFRARVEVTYDFLHSILGVVKKIWKDMAKLAGHADREAAAGKVKELSVRTKIAPWKEDVEILWERAVADEHTGTPDPETGLGSIRRTGEIVPMRMTDYGIFVPTESAPLPAAYVIDLDLNHVVQNLLQHGIVVERMTDRAELKLSEFEIESAHRAESAFQGHHELTIDGTWRDVKRQVEPGTFIVRTEQPLARLIFYLLEARSDDGLVNWNFLDSPSEAVQHLIRTVLPIRKSMQRVAAPAVVV